jgi:hypothetical protein
MTDDEITRMRGLRRRGNWIRNIFRRHRDGEQRDPREDQLDVYHVAVERCFVPDGFSDEMPLYVLALGDVILILFGQWMYDPHVVIASNQACDKWSRADAFFKNFSLRWSAQDGVVFELKLNDESFVPCERLPSSLSFTIAKECQAICGRGETVMDDLEKAGLIEHL